MERLIDCFDFEGKQVVSLIGSGGKTSLMWYLAECYRQEKVLVSTTTKIGCPVHQPYDFFYSQDFSKVGTDGKGITLAGTRLSGGHKLSAPPSMIQQSFPMFDKIFLEADGSKQLPLKGWETFEPVVIPETTATIGLIPISVLNEKIDLTTVHRLPLFLRATGTKTGDVICEETLAEVISSPKGLWAKSRGHRILCINQVESSEQLKQAEKVLSLLPCMLMKRLTKVIACNVQSGKGVVLWEK
ncbi:selenium cofactor biosynthesis protein YqeC [Enterococcus wangshanyuanii]|uniref:Hydroxylase accessory protein YqeC n=1 Tax=Enterococcus wangshanyuanii TaxID=2005703 RepID=A0ABQ1NJL5_9ENTE|nr:selenium cofactor biosynthesis protein YqeC [Enterococcus wangshanyuanii]GGC78889.1 hydroxylase accessory protein YqeC [Enterococcus wangshanyuanii]